MWIRNTLGRYVNADNIFNIRVCELPSGDWSITAYSTEKDLYETIALFNSKGDAQLYLDKMMAAVANKIFKVDMADWNYKGHKKDHKETRRGGS